MSRLMRRRDRVKEEIPITTVLLHYGYQVHAEEFEQQFPCDLHGDGFDSKPSGRVYPDSNDWYCFACDKTRDAISMVMEKEGVEFAPAIRLLEERYHLPELPWEDDDDRPFQETLSQEIGELVDGGKKEFGPERTRVGNLLDSLTRDGDLPLKQLLAFWEMYDRICWMVDKNKWDEPSGCAALDKLRERALKRVTEG